VSGAAAIALFLLVFLVSAVALGARATVARLRKPASTLPPALVERRAALRVRVRAAVAAVAPGATDARAAASTQARPAEPAAAPRDALAAAEAALAAAPDDADTHLRLAEALVRCDELVAAAAELARARALGADGAIADYLDGRLRLAELATRAATGAGAIETSPQPSLLTPFDLLILQLARERRAPGGASAVWLAGPGGRSLDRDDISALVAGHVATCCDALDRLLAAVERAPAFGAAHHHLARAALKLGFVDEGRALLEAIDPLIADGADRRGYERDRAELRGDAAPAADAPPIGSDARRSPRLVILK
jgi:hypothetical protein